MSAPVIDRFETARTVADAVLYEGYVLYPYRASSRKNHARFQWGVLTPRAFSEAEGSERWAMRTECLVAPGACPALSVRVRCLHSQRRRIERLLGGRFEVVDSLEVDGTLHVEGHVLVIRKAADAVRAGIGTIPEDRKAAGLALEASVADNIALASLHRISAFGFTNARKRDTLAEEYRASLGIRCASIAAPVGSLSGGNQQKVLIARWLASGARVIAIEEPTHGVDIGAKAEIHRQLAAFAEAGGSVIFMSTELRELLAIAHRIAIFHAGRLEAIVPHHDATESIITAIATGIAAGNAA